MIIHNENQGGKYAGKSMRQNLFLMSLAKFLSGFAGYIYDIGIVIYLFSQTKS